MVTKRTELKIRGLTEKEINYLKAQSKRTKSKSFNKEKQMKNKKEFSENVFFFLL